MHIDPTENYLCIWNLEWADSVCFINIQGHPEWMYQLVKSNKPENLNIYSQFTAKFHIKPHKSRSRSISGDMGDLAKETSRI